MTSIKPTFFELREQIYKINLSTWIAIFYQGFVLIAFLLIPFWSTDFINRPYLGQMLDKAMVVNGYKSLVDKAETGTNRSEIAFGDKLLTINDQAVTSSAELYGALIPYQMGDIVKLSVIKYGETAPEIIEVQLKEFSRSDRWVFFYIPYMIGLVYLICAMWVLFVRRGQISGLVFGLFSSSFALVLAGIYDLGTSHHLTVLWLFALGLAGATIFHLILYFPKKDPLVERYQWLQYAGYFVSGVLFINSVRALYFSSRTADFGSSRLLLYLFLGLSLVASLFWYGLRRTRLASSIERVQIRIILFGLIVSFFPIGLWLIGSPLWIRIISFSPIIIIPIVIFPICITYTMQRYRVLRSDFLLSRGVIYVTLAVIVTAAYALLVAGLGLVIGNILAADSPLVSGVVLFVLALIFDPVRQKLLVSVDSLFFRGKRAYQDRLQTFSGELTTIVELDEVVQILRFYIDNSLLPSSLHIFIYDPLTDHYAASQGKNGRPTTDLKFSLGSVLIRILVNRHSPLFVSDLEMMPNIGNEMARIAMLQSHLLVPLPGQKKLSGWLSLGERLSGEPYSSADIDYLESLCDQAALAIERATVFINMDSRVREVNVLAKVAQGINITVSLDDIFELIYAQTTQVIPADDFHIQSADYANGFFTYLFYVENDERLQEKENVPTYIVRTLENEVVRHRRPILTDDYNLECQHRGLVSNETQLMSWLGVPLNSGAETIGVLSLSKRDNTLIYTQEQLNLLQTIADQVAGAIVKARLLQESEQRARQLSFLNEVTRQLTSTLELEPLLQNILRSATEILDCEAGSLFLVDRQTDELIFRVTVGPVAEDLIGKRLPAGTGVVGKAVKERRPIIENNVDHSVEWFSKTDAQTGFMTQALLAVPMVVKDRVLGVIEVINRRDHMPFSENDEYLLSAFSAQAAVAMENARLYTLTDQALTERVEELSVMQRIDRELNTSLDLSNAMNITLKWAIRQSGADAGMIGLLDDVRLLINDFQGYQTELEPYERLGINLETHHLIPIVKNGTLFRKSLNDNDNEPGLFLSGAVRQVIIPIQMEAVTKGLLILESCNQGAFDQDNVNFLMRLIDHAAIAITNSQLYAAVQAANVAKSEFVSFVSHELKNPMTSIKGYTELLAAGAVGPITDPQANFLRTIRSNVDRMATLVSDLADVSRIEAGRLRLDYSAVNLKEVVDEVVRSLKRQVEEKKQSLDIQIPESNPVVWADRTRMVQILTNLVSNSCKYTPVEGSVTISAEVSENKWDSEGAPQVTHLWVEDSGIGIAEEDQQKIFQKFFRSEDSKTREAPGTGLGLNITKSLVELQGGKIWFESQYRVGTTFHFTMPLAEK